MKPPDPARALMVDVVREGRDTWVRIKSADRNSFLLKPRLQ